MGIVSRILFALAVAAPWLWLIAFALLTAAVVRIVGHMPSYGYPMPTMVTRVYWNDLYAFSRLMALVAIASPLVLSAVSAIRQLTTFEPLPSVWMLVNLAGFALMLAFYLIDPAGLATWYID